jgi:Domain of unknown function (DUF303).
MKRTLLTLVIIFSFSISMFGRIILPSVFSDNMVLQQNSEVAIWGWAGPGETLKIVASWSPSDTIKVKVNNSSRWTTSIKTTGAGGPYSIKISGIYDTLQLVNIMLGEVWICSGQSNMEMSVYSKIFNGEEEAAKADNPNIRIFHIQKMGAEYPQQNCVGNWTVSTPETMRATSAVGYFFAHELQQRLNVPIGIIVAAWGGSPAEIWIDKNHIERDSILNKDKYREQYDWWPNVPGAAYNAMIYPILPYEIAGAIWYQGESNINNYPIYSLLQKTLIEKWRSDFKKAFPFYFVQIAPFDYGTNLKSPYLREQQELVTKIVPNTGMVVVSDLVDDIKDIHPKNKIDVGKRLAAYALSEVYKQNSSGYKSPFYESMTIEKDKIRIKFTNVETGLKVNDGTPSKFLIAGNDHKFVQALAKIEGNTVLVYSKFIAEPKAVRFCFDNATIPDIFNGIGLPVAPFRTDNWEESK